METMAPTSPKSQVLLYIVTTLTLVMSLVIDASLQCIPGINMAGHQNFGQALGQSVILKCPILLCHLELPNVTWCKISGDPCDPVRSGEGISSGVEDHREDSAVYILKFESVQMNDTGYYRCKAIFKDQTQIVGSTVQIAVSDVSGEHVVENNTAVNITETGSTDKIQTFTMLLYIIPLLGGVCVLIIIISLIIYCQRHLKVNHRSSPQDPAPTEELQFVPVPGSAKNNMQGATLTQMDTNLISVTAEVTYDNAHMGFKATTQKASDPEEDSIVYADLNYNAKQTGFHFDDNCDVEYATVHLNEARKNDI
ncbi:B- and T-lymphocyte attenuator-like [Dendropsophus ebraccatus]|uniref:B- and T-lymphocyte attenuator-like n=1 Tax=Dendropsophus ebraccatus TaxID=150705 RepID=UPI00383204D0